MTIVIAHNIFTSIVMIADCRVSYPHNPPDDNLQKIYRITDKMVLGFSGPLDGAYEVMNLVRENVRDYSKQDDVVRLVKYAYRQTKPEERKNLSIILASVEPKRETTFRFQTSDGEELPKPKWFPYVPELQILSLKPRQSDPSELIIETGNSILGVEKDIRGDVQTTVNKLFGVAFKQPTLQLQIIVTAIMATLMEKRIASVGGMFQAVQLSQNGIGWLAYNLPSPYGDVALDYFDGRFIQRDNVSKREVPLNTIWEWKEQWGVTNHAGSSGVFEDPGLRRATDKLAEKKAISDSQSENKIA